MAVCFSILRLSTYKKCRWALIRKHVFDLLTYLKNGLF